MLSDSDYIIDQIGERVTSARDGREIDGHAMLELAEHLARAAFRRCLVEEGTAALDEQVAHALNGEA